MGASLFAFVCPKGAFFFTGVRDHFSAKARSSSSAALFLPRRGADEFRYEGAEFQQCRTFFSFEGVVAIPVRGILPSRSACGGDACGGKGSLSAKENPSPHSPHKRKAFLAARRPLGQALQLQQKQQAHIASRFASASLSATAGRRSRKTTENLGKSCFFAGRAAAFSPCPVSAWAFLFPLPLAWRLRKIVERTRKIPRPPPQSGSGREEQRQIDKLRALSTEGKEAID